MTSRKDATDESVGFLVSDVARLMRSDFNSRARSLGLSQAQWRALAYLNREEGVRQVTLAERLEVQPITLARLIDKLQDAGLVERHADPADRRAVRLYLSDDARPLLERMRTLVDETLELALAGLDEARRRQLTELLGRVKQNLHAPAVTPEVDAP